MKRRTLHRSVLALALVLLSGSAWATNGGWIDITGDFFNRMSGKITLCAKVSPMEPWEAVFCGETPYGLKFSAGPMYSNSIGRICIRTSWPQGVYAVEALALQNSYLRGSLLESEDVAVSVFNPYRFCGAQGGGALNLRSYDVPPNVKKTLASRQATFAYIFKQSVPQNYGIWYFDNDYPDGELEFVARSFTDILYADKVDGLVNYKTVEVRGNGWLEIDGDEMFVHYVILADDYPGDNRFYIEFWDFTGRLLYRSAAIGTPVEWDEQHVFDGKNVVDPCD